LKVGNANVFMKMLQSFRVTLTRAGTTSVFSSP
jgi:hypothetical protein